MRREKEREKKKNLGLPILGDGVLGDLVLGDGGASCNTGTKVAQGSKEDISIDFGREV